MESSKYYKTAKKPEFALRNYTFKTQFGYYVFVTT